MPTPPKIKVENLTKSFGKKHVLRGVSVELGAGESLVVIGGSGSGKSVFIKNIIGLMTPTSGTVFIDGEDTTNLNERARNRLMHKFGYLFQGGALFDSLPIWQNVAFGLLQVEKMNPIDAREKAVEKIRLVGMDPDVCDLFPGELSGGMQKRISLARTIATNPEIIFFDEPTTGLDPIMSDVINELVIRVREETGATTITITHDMHSVRRIGGECAMIYEGKFIWNGHIDDIDHSGNAHVDQFITGSFEGPIKLKLQDH